MRIEKLSDNQIRCILTKKDLEERHLRLSELAYGSDKARGLFGDMMQEASYKYGFQADDTPLMIEAIPMAGGSITLIVTKVDNPEELDTRFSSFAPSITPGQGEAAGYSALDQLINSIRSEAAGQNVSSAPSSRKDGEDASRQIRQLKDFILKNRLYSFPDMNSVIRAAKMTGGIYSGQSSLLFDPDDGRYYLFLRMRSADEVADMQGILASVSEYGSVEAVTAIRQNHLTEHGRVIIANDALGQLWAL